MEGKGRIDVGPGKPVWAFGVMTGTSMDGVDVAVILTDGETISDFGDAVSREIDEETQLKVADTVVRISDVPTALLQDRDPAV